MGYWKVICTIGALWGKSLLNMEIGGLVLWRWLSGASTPLLYDYPVGCVPLFYHCSIYCLCLGWSAQLLFLRDTKLLRSVRFMLKCRSPTDPANLAACSLSWIPEWPGTLNSLNNLLALCSSQIVLPSSFFVVSNDLMALIKLNGSCGSSIAQSLKLYQ